MAEEEEIAKEIPEFVKKYVPGVKRGLSWAKYAREKKEGTAMKSEAFEDSKSEGYQAALATPLESDSDQILTAATKDLWAEAERLTEEVKKISITINNQNTKEERDEVLGLAKEAARKAGLQAAVAAGWEKGWKEGLKNRDSKN
ncbi:MAG: hypothetical protein CMB06_04325 [Euryarchaeota archaeon]|nr:hypothetical protein [Euryarchaeota archaeon]|tara:strand:- start:5764 stop:6195 length:432 start_codon:yes stop_codon:yes gene_type:complete